jgi:hypothetical protein
MNRPIKEHEEAVRFVDLPPTVTLNDLPRHAIVAPDQVGSSVVTQAFDQRSRIRQVAQDKCTEKRFGLIVAHSSASIE